MCKGAMSRKTEAVSATHSTPPQAAATAPTAPRAVTVARSAAAMATERSPAQRSDVLRVVTPYIAPAWRSALEQAAVLEEYANVVAGIQEGFRLGISNAPLASSYIPSNHQSALSLPDVINDYITTELIAGRYCGPFTRTHLINLVG